MTYFNFFVGFPLSQEAKRGRITVIAIKTFKQHRN